MSRQNDSPTPDILNQATQSLREALLNVPTPTGPPDEVVAATIQLLEASIVRQENAPRRGRRELVFRIARYGGMAVAATFLAIVAGWLFVADGTSSLAFADVVESVKDAKSVTFVTTMKGSRPRMFRQKFYVQGNAYRTEIPSAQEGAQAPPDAPPVLVAIIADPKQKKAVQLDFVRKTARLIQADEKAWQAMAKGSNPVEQLRQLKGDDAERLGDEVLEGRTRQVYRLKKRDVFMGVRITNGETATLWADPETGLPVRIAVERVLPDGKVEAILIFEHFTWNEALDPDLFRVEIPEGYTIESGAEPGDAKARPSTPDIKELQSLENRVRETISKVTPYVVAVAGALRQAGPPTQPQPWASGVMISADGLILSQYHVSHGLSGSDWEKSRKAGERLKVMLHDGRECEAELLGADRTYDLSLLRLLEPGPYPHATVDDKVTADLGAPLLFLGHPENHHGSAPTVRLGRVLFWQDDMFVSDCQIAPGDSGGPFFDLDGHLVGMIRNSDRPEALQGSFRRASGLAASSPVSLIASCLDPMLDGDLSAVDGAAIRKMFDKARAGKTLPLDQWTQGEKAMTAYRESAALARASVVAIQDRDELTVLGTVVDADGYILSKASELPAEPACRLPNGDVAAAEVVGVDPAFDLALLKVSANGLRPVEWADDVAPATGTFVAVPGPLESPLAVGMVSAARRDSEGPHPTKMAPRRFAAAALPEVIGSAVQGRGYWVEYAEGNAAAAGVQPGDVILTIGGRAVRGHQDLAGCVKGHWAGEPVPVHLLRSGNALELTLRLRAERQPLFSHRGSDFPTFFEHDAPLSAHECGGPVVGLDGKALGVTMARVGPHGCLAIPADCVQRLLAELKSGRLAANWVKPQSPTNPGPPQSTAPKAGKAATIGIADLKQGLTKRAEAFKSLLVEYDLVTEAHVEPRLLMAWNLAQGRDWQERHRIAFSGAKRFTQIVRPEVQPLYAPQDQVAPAIEAPPPVALAVERQRKEGMARKKKGQLNYLFAGTSAQELRSLFDGATCFVWNEPRNQMVPAADAGAYNSPLMYLAGLGLRPIDPESANHAEQRKQQRHFWFPDNFALYENSRVLPNEELVDGAECVVLEAGYHREWDGKRHFISEKIFFDPLLGLAPRRWVQWVDGLFSGSRTNSNFDEFAPGCWLPWESTWTRGTPAWVAIEMRNRPAYTYNLHLRKARINDVHDELFKP